MKILPVVKTDNNFLFLAERCKASWDYFHPDIPMHLVRQEVWKPYMDELKQTPKYLEHSMTIGLFYAIQKMIVEKYDLLIHLDSDVVVTGRCDEIIEGDYDIAVSETAGYIGEYNAGVWASTSLDFIKSFYYVHLVTPISDNSLFMVLVRTFFHNVSKIKVLDNSESGVWYNEKSREWWNRLMVKDEKLYTPDRQVKMLHWASGIGNPDKKISCSLFSDEVKQWLNKITGGTSFTDNDGKEFGDFLIRTYNL